MSVLRRLAYKCLVLGWRIVHPITVGVWAILIQESKVLLVRHSYQAACTCPGAASREERP